MPDNNNAAYWNMATQMAGTAANVASQSNTNKKERAFAEKMMWQNRTWAIEDWQKTNAYNHPSEQMARLRMAGLNPNLIYGNSGGAMPSAPIRSTESAKWNPKAPDFSGVGSAVMSFYDTQIKDATIQNLKSQNRLIEEQANKTKIEAEAIQPRVDNLRAGTKLLTTNNKLAEIAALVRSGTMGADIDYAKQRLIKLVADTEYTKNQDIRAAVQNAQSIRESVERVLSSRFHRLQLGEAQIKKIRAEMRNMDLDAQAKEIDLKLREMNIHPGSPWYLKTAATAAGSVVDKVLRTIEAGKKYLPNPSWYKNPDKDTERNPDGR